MSNFQSVLNATCWIWQLIVWMWALLVIST